MRSENYLVVIYKCQVSDFDDFIVVIVGKYSGGRKYALKYSQLMGHEIGSLTPEERKNTKVLHTVLETFL